ncbi:MAG TPA: MFS transporter [Desulfobacterales bacterium]|nr:MFS transporter [Desulfobacterales bacterium]
MQFTRKTERVNFKEPFISCLAAMIAVSTVFMTQSVFIEISDSFNVDLSRARFAFSVVSLFYATSFLMFGPAADRFDLQKMSSAGLFFSAIGVFAAAIVGNFNRFIISMAVIGICASAVAASMLPYMVKIAPKEKKSIYLGSFVAASTTGVVIGRFSVGIMTSSWGLANTFKIIAMTICIFSLLTAIVLNGKKISNAPKACEKYSKSYLKALKLIISPELLRLLMTGFFLFFGFLGMLTFLTLRLTNAPFYFTSADIGWISLAGLTALIGSPLSGILAQKISVFTIMIASLSLCLISVQLMGWIPLALPVCTGLLLLFLGVYFCQPLIFLLISQKVPQKYLGTASSFYILFCIGGGSVSSVALGPVWELFGWQGVTLICSGSLVIAMALCIKGKNQQ